MPIVGTAGHVDHGKSTLIEALTGSDPDRWAEEKERGLTIDLGFAWAMLDGIDVGFVDVPGHERFIKNMLAGVGALDCALFVVAADSGWMPQSEEHAAVMDLLDVGHGVIALSRIDLVDDETTEIAELEIIEEVEGTALERWPIVRVSATTGVGMDALREAIVGCIRASDRNSSPSSGFRLWVDRSFTVAGAGQVVTGTVLSGTAHVDDELELLPSHGPVRVRGLHHHGRPTRQVRRGERAAINVVGPTPGIERGALLATPGTVVVSNRLLASITPARGFERIPDRGAFHIHAGTASRAIEMRRVGDSDAFVLRADGQIPAVVGDRVILRDAGRRSVVGGGRILDPVPPHKVTIPYVQALAEVVDAPANTKAQVLLELGGTASGRDLSTRTFGGTPPEFVGSSGSMASSAYADDLAKRLALEADRFHAAHPTRPGLAKGEVLSRYSLDPAVLDAVVERSAELSETAGSIHRSSFVHSLDPTQEQAWAGVRAALEESFDVPRLSAVDLPPDVIHFLLRRGDLVRITEDLAYTRSQVEDIVEGVEDLDDGFTVSEFKEHFGMTRRQAVPTVEWLDSIGRTRRSGDGRMVRNRT